MHLSSTVFRLLPSTTNAAITCRRITWASRVGTTRAYTSTPTDQKSPPRKTAIITGASGGIGSAIAHRFAKEGLSTVLIGRNLSKLETVLRGLDTSRTPTSGSRQHRIEVGDIGREEFWTTLSKNLKSNNEACGVLVNAAGLTHASLMVRTQGETIDQILSTNLTGTILGCKTVLKGMLPKKEGVIVNVASLLAVRGGKGASVYAASKAGILGELLACRDERQSERVSANENRFNTSTRSRNSRHKHPHKLHSPWLHLHLHDIFITR